MPKRNIRQLIINAAWRLFRERGYENITIADILKECNIAKGSFYYYFKGKEDLLETLSVILDKKYEEIIPYLDRSLHTLDQLLCLSIEVHRFVEENINRNLLTFLYANQITVASPCSLTDHNRFYFRLLARIIEEGQQRGEIITTMSVTDIADYYSLCEWGIIIRWCLNRGTPSLVDSTQKNIPMMIESLRADASLLQNYKCITPNNLH